ncbi:MAG: hypothetical protein KatS3mg118_1453 [Paracoccaceae bacterium]|nr:MAG: hypothetical protein KatS3mg118_1453 [Paracoccaceae bacterium]
MAWAERDLGAALAHVAEGALRASGMDCAGLYLSGPDGGLRGVVLGLPEAFAREYQRQGVAIDPVLARVRATGAPASTLVTLGARWTQCQLYRRISGRFGLAGFATFPLYAGDRMSGVLCLGALAAAGARRLDHEGLCTMSPHAMRAAVGLVTLPPRHPRLTRRQNEVAMLAARGLTNRQIAEELGTGTAAVHKHMKELNRLFGTATRTAMAAAWRAGCGDRGSPFGD